MSLLIGSDFAQAGLSPGTGEHAVVLFMQCRRRRSVAGKGLVNKVMHLGCSLGSFVLCVGTGAQLYKHDSLAWEPLPRRLPWFPRVGR